MSSSFYHDEELYQIVFLHWDEDIIFLLCRWLPLTDFLELNQPFIPVVNRVWSWLMLLRATEVCLRASQVHTNAGDAGYVGLIPGSGRSPRLENWNPLQYSCLGNPMHRGAWWAAVFGVAQSWTWLSTHSSEGFATMSRPGGPPRLGVASHSRSTFFARPWAAFKWLSQDSNPGVNPASAGAHLGEMLHLPALLWGMCISSEVSEAHASGPSPAWAPSRCLKF